MITVNSRDPVPPYEQIRGQIAGSIRTGELAAGTRLPSVRQLAGDLRVAPGTVARAYALLADEGLVVTNRASGTRVCEGQALSGRLDRAAARYVEAAQANGASLDAAIAALRARWL